jgi:hypothetical protein
MNISQIALISETQDVSFSELSKVSAALQKQATRDLAPIWDVKATVDCFDKLESVPPGYWTVTVRDDLDPAEGPGVHKAENGQPFALVHSGDGWSISASHEVLEIIVDPFGQRFISAQSPMNGQGRVDVLVEVCDPCQAAAFAYPVNGIPVSDFITPHYFEPVSSTAVRYSYTGSIKRPLEVLAGGYLSWHDPVSGHLFQESFFAEVPDFADLGDTQPMLERSLRSVIYSKTPQALEARRNIQGLQRLSSAKESVNAAANSGAVRLRRQIAAIVQGQTGAGKRI